MTTRLDETHDPALRSFVESANDPSSDFPIQNLPFGVFRTGADPRIGVAIGDRILDLAACSNAGLLATRFDARWFSYFALNPLMAAGREAMRGLRTVVSGLLRSDSPHRDAVELCLVPTSEVAMLLPARIGDYTDFYASIHHATNVGSMFRPDNPLLPNYKWLPVGYHGRASSIVVSGTPFHRPSGQTRDDAEKPPQFGPSRRLDYEMEVGFFVGTANSLGEPVRVDDAWEHIFGFALVNDWSARDIQTWEYQPLGPFLAKNFATTISPWVVTADALEPFRVAAFQRAAGDPQPLPHLASESERTSGGIDLQVEVRIASATMRERFIAPMLVSRGNFADMYWTVGQMLAHHTSNGCNLQTGDLIASGTVSGPAKESRGCLLERTWRGTEPIELPTGETRTFLEDGDEVIMRGRCEREGRASIGFGECRGIVLPAIS